MPKTKYRGNRILALPLCRMPREDKAGFKNKLQRLRDHFERFNLDVSEICQWLFSLRQKENGEPNQAASLWHFFLETESYFPQAMEDEIDRNKRVIFDVILDLASTSDIGFMSDHHHLIDSIVALKSKNSTQTAKALFARLKNYEKSRRQILLKAATDLIIARYLRAYENWMKKLEEWEKENKNWHNDNPGLNPEIINDFNAIFSQLKIKRNSPRVCTWKYQNEHDAKECLYFGHKINGKFHSDACKRFNNFLNSHFKIDNGKHKKFSDCAHEYWELRQKNIIPQHALNQIVKQHRAAWFPEAWQAYLNKMGINESTILRNSPFHCFYFSGNRPCDFVTHTEKCKEYFSLLKDRTDLHEKEDIYWKWRKALFPRPPKPVFRYPSTKTVPVPKLFGAGYFKIDFENSVVGLRLDHMQEGEFEQFAFNPWPKDYSPQPDRTEITSVQVNFVGLRPRIGFNFKVEHKKARFEITQDEIDQIRSRKFPLASQDHEFLATIKSRLKETFTGGKDAPMRILAVDTGTAGGGFAVFNGDQLEESGKLNVVKVDKLFDSYIYGTAQDCKEYKKGLTVEHISRHKNQLAEEARKIAQKRSPEDKVSIRKADLRGLKVHFGRMVKDWVRLNASQIIKIATSNKVDLIVFESHRDYRIPGYNEKERGKAKERLAIFSPARIRKKVTEKAVEKGMRVITVPFYKSSQICGKCGEVPADGKNKTKWIDNKRKGKFICHKCGYKDGSDINAAIVIGKVFWGEIAIPRKRS